MMAGAAPAAHWTQQQQQHQMMMQQQQQAHYAQGGQAAMPQGAPMPPQQQLVQGHYGGGGPAGGNFYGGVPAMGGSQPQGGVKKIVLNLTDKDSRSTRRYHILIRGSLAGFAKNPQAAQWALLNENILKRKIVAAAEAQRHGNLEKTVILDARLHWTKSSCPKTVIARCSAFRGNSYTNTGQRGFIVIPNGKVVYSGSDGRGLRVMRPHVIVGTSLMATYGHVDEKTLRAPLTKVKETPYTMVPCDHPIMRIISLNADKLDLNMDEYKQMCGNQFPVVDELVESCLGQINKQVHSLNPWSDMRRGKFTISVVPADASEGENKWDCLDCVPGIGREFTRNETNVRVLKTPFNIELYITITYAIADPAFASAEASPAS